MNMKKTQGFTLIELMIVIAIIAILAALALPQYQNYMIRTKNAECLSVADAAKLAVAETAQSEGGLARVTAANHGYVFDAAGTKFCDSVVITPGTGVITAVTENTGGPVTFTLTPTPREGALDWACTSANNPAHVPSSCRAAAAP